MPPRRALLLAASNSLGKGQPLALLTNVISKADFGHDAVLRYAATLLAEV